MRVPATAGPRSKATAPSASRIPTRRSAETPLWRTTALPPIARVLEQVRDHGLTSEARSLLDQRLANLSRRSIALLQAGGTYPNS